MMEAGKKAGTNVEPEKQKLKWAGRKAEGKLNLHCKIPQDSAK